MRVGGTFAVESRDVVLEQDGDAMEGSPGTCCASLGVELCGLGECTWVGLDDGA